MSSCLIKEGINMLLFNKVSKYVFKFFNFKYYWAYLEKIGFSKVYELEYLLEKLDKKG